MSDFPPAGMTAKEDTSKIKQTQSDDVIRTETDGGYVITRRRHTRAPRKVFTLGFTDISNADKVLLENFYASNSASIFTWTDWTSGTEFTVRFKEPLKFKYTGRGDNKRWNVEDFVLEQV